MATARQSDRTTHPLSFWVLQGLRFLVYLLLFPVALFLSAGRLDWGIGWAVFGVVIGAALVSRVLVARKNPDLLEERASAGEREGVQPWDPWLVRVIGLLGPTAIAVTAGLDHRLGWTVQPPAALPTVGLGLLIAGYVLSIWAMVTNRFFSAYVRIQTDRGHIVVSDGPYRWVRHPSYAGGIVGNIGLALALGSLWALIPAGVTITVMIVRTALEDRTLHAGLPGYSAYAEKVRYRLVPGLW